MSKKAKKLGKEIVGTVVKIQEIVTGKQLEFDFAKLPKEIQAKLGPFGLSHKLGDAAAGKAGQEAVDSIQKVFDGLMKGDWNVKGIAGEKVSVTAINAGIDKLPPAEAAAAKALLLKLGIIKDPKTTNTATAPAAK